MTVADAPSLLINNFRLNNYTKTHNNLQLAFELPFIIKLKNAKSSKSSKVEKGSSNSKERDPKGNS